MLYCVVALPCMASDLRVSFVVEVVVTDCVFGVASLFEHDCTSVLFAPSTA